MRSAYTGILDGQRQAFNDVLGLRSDRRAAQTLAFNQDIASQEAARAAEDQAWQRERMGWDRQDRPAVIGIREQQMEAARAAEQRAAEDQAWQRQQQQWNEQDRPGIVADRERERKTAEIGLQEKQRQASDAERDRSGLPGLMADIWRGTPKADIVARFGPLAGFVDYAERPDGTIEFIDKDGDRATISPQRRSSLLRRMGIDDAPDTRTMQAALTQIEREANALMKRRASATNSDDVARISQQAAQLEERRNKILDAMGIPSEAEQQRETVDAINARVLAGLSKDYEKRDTSWGWFTPPQTYASDRATGLVLPDTVPNDQVGPEKPLMPLSPAMRARIGVPVPSRQPAATLSRAQMIEDFIADQGRPPTAAELERMRAAGLWQ